MKTISTVTSLKDIIQKRGSKIPHRFSSVAPQNLTKIPRFYRILRFPQGSGVHGVLLEVKNIIKDQDNVTATINRRNLVTQKNITTIAEDSGILHGAYLGKRFRWMFAGQLSHYLSL